jgi:hypothetical protein
MDQLPDKFEFKSDVERLNKMLHEEIKTEAVHGEEKRGKKCSANQKIMEIMDD